MTADQLPDKSKLPSDPEKLKEMIINGVIEKNRIIHRYNEVEEKYHILRHEVFGKKSEKYIAPDPNQMEMDELLGEVKKDPNLVESIEEVVTRKKFRMKKAGHGRNPFPEHLPKVREVIEPCEDIQEKVKRGEAVFLGEEVTRRLAKRQSFYVKELVRLKYVLVNRSDESEDDKDINSKIIIADYPETPIEKTIADTSLLSWAIVSKYQDHLPLFRLENILRRDKIFINRSTMVGWLDKLHALLLPIYQAMVHQVKNHDLIHSDDTSMPVCISKKKTKTQIGRMWVFISESTVVYAFHENKSSQCPTDFLKGCKGFLQTDAAPTYNKAIQENELVPAGCWAHGRRYFYRALDNHFDVAKEAIEMMKTIFAYERRWQNKNLTPSEIEQNRKIYQQPLVDQFKAWVKNEIKTGGHTPASKIGKALGYFDARWEQFYAFIQDGRIPMTNNISERAMRDIVIGRKNHLFVGNIKGGHRAALYYSLVGTCKLLKIDPNEYFCDILEKVATWPIKQIADLTPIAWKNRNQPA